MTKQELRFRLEDIIAEADKTLSVEDVNEVIKSFIAE